MQLPLGPLVGIGGVKLIVGDGMVTPKNLGQTKPPTLGWGGKSRPMGQNPKTIKSIGGVVQTVQKKGRSFLGPLQPNNS